MNPKIVDHTSCKNVNGWITTIGADLIANVMVIWPKVAMMAVKKSRYKFVLFILSQSYIARGIKNKVVNKDKYPTISFEFFSSETCFTIKYENEKTNAANNIHPWPVSNSLKPGLNIIRAPIKEINIAKNLKPVNFSLNINKEPIQIKIGVKKPIAVTSAIVITVIE